jgi:hypothetical protein
MIRIIALGAMLVLAGCAQKDSGWNGLVFSKIGANAPLVGDDHADTD